MFLQIVQTHGKYCRIRTQIDQFVFVRIRQMRVPTSCTLCKRACVSNNVLQVQPCCWMLHEAQYVRFAAGILGSLVLFRWPFLQLSHVASPSPCWCVLSAFHHRANEYLVYRSWHLVRTGEKLAPCACRCITSTYHIPYPVIAWYT